MKRGLVILIVLIFVFSSFLVLTPVLATNACCEQDGDGNWCQYTDESDCSSSYLATSTSCEQTSYCQVGCCYSSEEGSCSKNTPRATCEAEEGYSWSTSADCAIDQCNKGCCVIGDQAFFVTEVKCKSVGSGYEEAAVSFDDSVETESACLGSVKNLDFGCCVDGSDAIFETRQECSVATSEVDVNFTVDGFHEGMLCSNDLLSTECAKQQYTGCYDGKVYWYDSCGNRENIYSSDDRVSYNSGYVLAEEDSCTPSGPYDTDCGNCDYALGETCGVDEDNVMADGDYTCIDLDCETTYENDASPQSGEAKKNGESWCIYDQAVGQGLDTVGSRHYRHLCVNGEEVTEPCTDYREEICVGGVLGEDSLNNLEALHLGDGDYVEAACRENRGDTCSACNDETLGLTDQYECCAQEDTQDCYWLPTGAGILEGETYEDGRCIPQVPQGQKFWGEDSESNDISSSTCAVASATCTVTYRIGGFNKLFGGSDDPDKWDIIAETPDNCATKDWLIDQNTYCHSLGDCGAKYNLVGDASFDGFSSTMIDEAFFNDVKDIEPLDIGDLGDFDSLKSVDEVDEGDIWFSFKEQTPNFYQNPAFLVASIGAVVGGVSNIVNTGTTSCMGAAGAAKVAADAATASKAFDALKGTAIAGFVGCVTSGTDASKKCSGTLQCITGSDNKNTCTVVDTKTSSSSGSQTSNSKSCLDLLYTNGGSGDSSSYYRCSGTSYTICQESDGVGKESSEKYSIASYGSYPYLSCGTPEGYTIENTATYISKNNNHDTCGLSPKTKGMACVSNAEKGTTCTDEPLADYCSGEVTRKCCTQRTASPAPAFAPYYAADSGGGLVADATGALSGAKGGLDLLSSFKDAGTLGTVGCFFSGALPIPTKLLGGASKSFITGFANWITLGATVYLIIDYANDNQTTIVYTADCNTWQAPKGGDNCELCNNVNMPCSEYRCHAYGASCSIINEGSDNETCVSLYVNDVNSPIIEPLPEALEMDGYTITETTEEGAKGYEVEELIPAFTPITLGIYTDEPAQCKYTPEVGTEFDTMSNYVGTDIYTYNHTMTFALGSEASSEEVVALNEGVYTVYVRCSDANGNANERDYFIRFTVDTTPDLTPAEILYTSIQDGSYMQYGLNETAFSIYTNEPAQCKWNINDTDYDMMATSMTCASSGFEQSSQYYGSYECSTTLTDVAENELNYFYFKCEDQSGNQNEDSFKFTTKQTQTPLVITSVSPSDTVYDTELALEVTTEDGAEDGVAVCGFSLEDVGYYSMAAFFTTNSSTHSQSLTLPEGDYTYYIACQDIAGNQVTNSTSFTVEIDTSGPSISSLYVDTVYSILSLSTDEDSACEYAPESFTYGDGSVMTGVNTTTEHEANLDDYQYYVICHDLYNNEASYFVDLSAWV